MSVSVLWDSINDDAFKFISENCHVVTEKKNNFSNPVPLTETWNLYKISCNGKQKVLHLPFWFFHFHLKSKFPFIHQITRPFALTTPNSKGDFTNERFKICNTVKLRDEQKIIVQKCVSILTSRDEKPKSVIMQCQPGFGKTFCSVVIASECSAKRICVVIQQAVLEEQWVEAFSKIRPDLIVMRYKDFSKKTASHRKTSSKCPSKGETSKTDRLRAAEAEFAFDVFIINIAVVQKWNEKYPSFFQCFDFLIADEVHCLMTPNRFASFLCMNFVNMCLALSATPMRYDGFDRAIPLFFGDQPHQIVYFAPQLFDVMIVNTNWTPTNFHTDSHHGFQRKPRSLNWSHVIHQQSLSEARNDKIVKAISHLHQSGRTILVLVKLKEQGWFLQNKLIQNNIACVCFFGNAEVSTFVNADCRVLIGTIQKIGTGFDCDVLDTLVVAVDCVQYFTQYIGRIMRKQNRIMKPVIVDFQDNFGPLKNHLFRRIQDYKQLGGVIKTWKLDQQKPRQEIPPSVVENGSDKNPC